jgi:hypothetical protein
VLLLISGTFDSPSPGAPKIAWARMASAASLCAQTSRAIARPALLDAPSEAHSEENALRHCDQGRSIPKASFSLKEASACSPCLRYLGSSHKL